MKINAKFVNPFIEAGINVVKQIAQIEVRRGHLSYKQKPEPSYGVSIIIGVYGFLVGKSPQERKVLFVDTLGELANMITGNATAILNKKKDFALKITTPAIATGDNISINLISNPTLVLGLYSQYGPIEVSVSLEEQEVLEEMGEMTSVLTEM
jgi:CheY-specific phosphatase CheX